MSREFEPIDDETPIEEYPGYIGHAWDWDFYPGPELEVLASFELQEYLERFRSGEKRELTLRELPEVFTCEALEFSSWSQLLDQLPSVTAGYDEGPSDAGPASGTGHVFFISEGVTTERLINEVTALRRALDDDFQEISKRPD
ncbi:hypothetical protein ACVI1J_005157 [Bradyrhizobium diazoefficiens]